MSVSMSVLQTSATEWSSKECHRVQYRGQWLECLNSKSLALRESHGGMVHDEPVPFGDV